jgi:hypothetical protein
MKYQRCDKPTRVPAVIDSPVILVTTMGMSIAEVHLSQSLNDLNVLLVKNLFASYNKCPIQVQAYHK